jgi:molybdenum cofactor synthesis domain-containing protein
MLAIGFLFCPIARRPARAGGNLPGGVNRGLKTQRKLLNIRAAGRCRRVFAMTSLAGTQPALASAHVLGDYRRVKGGGGRRRLSGLQGYSRCSAEPGKGVMTAMSALPEIVTAALLVIGDEILSGRTKDKNIGYTADYLTALGIDLKEVRVVSDDEAAIVTALNVLRKAYDYVFTTGGIGPTHDDITADSVAKAFGVPINVHPEAVAILKARMAKIGGELNEARLRMARIPDGATLVANKISGAPGFWIGNVIVMAGVPAVMQAMLDEVGPQLKTGIRLVSVTIRADAKEGDVGSELGAIAKAHPETIIGSYPFFDETLGPNTNIVVRARDPEKLAAVKAAVEAMLASVRAQVNMAAR